MNIFKRTIFLGLSIFAITLFDCNASSAMGTALLRYSDSALETVCIKYSELNAKVSEMPVFQHITTKTEKRIFDSFMKKEATKLCNNFMSTCCVFTSNDLKDNIGYDILEIVKRPIGRELLCTILAKYQAAYKRRKPHLLMPIVFAEVPDCLKYWRIVQEKVRKSPKLRTYCDKIIRSLEANESSYSFLQSNDNSFLIVLCPAESHKDFTSTCWVKGYDNEPSIEQLPFPSHVAVVHELIHALHCIERSKYSISSCDLIENRLLLGKDEQYAYFNGYQYIIASLLPYSAFVFNAFFEFYFGNNEEYRTMYGIMKDKYDRLNESAYNCCLSTAKPAVRITHECMPSVVIIEPLSCLMDRAMVKYHLGMENS